MPKLPDISLSADQIKGEAVIVRYVPLSCFQDLSGILWSENPKIHDMDAVVASIERYGFVDPPKWDCSLNQGDGGIVFGNGRTEAIVQTLLRVQEAGMSPPRGIPVAKLTGEWCVPVKFGVDSTSEAQARALGIDHNNLTMAKFTPMEMAGMYRPSDLSALLESARAEDQPLTFQGNIDELLASLQIDEPLLSPEEEEENAADLTDRADQGKIESRVKEGEIWTCGRHRVACCDSTKEENVRKLVGDREIHFVVADPPYGINVQHKSGRVGKGKLAQARKYEMIAGDDSIDTAIDSYRLASKLYPEVIHVWWGANHYSQSLPGSSCWIVWDKQNGDNNFADAELAWTNHKGAVRIFTHLWHGMIRASENQQRRVHPTQKPIVLFEWLYEKYGKPNDLIFDPFLGSGPSLIAAQQMGDRTVFGCELSPQYAEVVLQRFEALTGQVAELVGHL